MNWLKKGPELKMPKLGKGGLKLGKGGLKGARPKAPSIKPPAFVADLYYDLRDRRLLPVIALVLVAIAAVPILLGGDDEVFVPPPGGDSAGTQPPTANASDLTVVEATPGLRDYHVRLGDRSPTDPFKQRYTDLPQSAQVETTATTSTPTPEAPSAPTGVPPLEGGGESGSTAPSGGDGAGGAPPPSAGGGSEPGTHLFAYRPTVRFGVAGSEELTLHEHIPLGELLPRKRPVMVFIGASENGERVAFNLTREVTLVRGPGRCIGGKQDCSLLILRPGQAVDLLTTTPGRTFRLHVLAIDLVEVEAEKSASSSSAKANGSLAGLAVDRLRSATQ